MTKEKLQEVLEKHHRWLLCDKGANLSGANLSYANLSYANLSGANLSGASVNYVRGQILASIGNIGSRNATTIYHADTDVVFCGCFRGTLDEFIAQVERIYPIGHKHREEYDLAIAFFKLKKGQEQA